MKTEKTKALADEDEKRRWGTLEDLEHLYAISRFTAYYLIAEGKIKSRILRFKYSRGTGRRFVNFASVEKFLDQCPVVPTKGVSRRMRNAAIRSAAVRAAFNGRKKK